MNIQLGCLFVQKAQARLPHNKNDLLCSFVFFENPFGIY